MGNLMQKFNESQAECNKIFNDCIKSFEEEMDDKVIFTDKGGEKIRIIPFDRIMPYMPYMQDYGAIYRLFGITYTTEFRNDYLAVVCFDSISHFMYFPLSSLYLEKRIEIADMIKDYKPKEIKEYNYEGTRKFVAKLYKKSEI